MQRPESSTISINPGVYLYKDAQGEILYVGKARNLRKRILSYFRESSALPRKTVVMLSHAVTLETLSTTTEKEALLLESSLIKKHRPRYNIVLRDDKEYVLFRISRDTDFPRLEIVRQARKDGARYFGPVTSGAAARATWKSIHRAFPLRRCSDRAFRNRVRPCLYYHIGQCLAPCTEPVSQQDYAALLHKVELLLSGRSNELLTILRQAMNDAAEQLDYERAASLRDQIRAVESSIERQSVVLPTGSSMDVLGIAPVQGGLSLGILFVRDGRLVDGQTFFWSGLELDDGQELISSFLGQFYGAQATIPPRIVVPWLPEETEDEATDEPSLSMLEAALAALRGASVRITTPRGSAESNLVDMAVANARDASTARTRQPVGERLAQFFRPALEGLAAGSVPTSQETRSPVEVIRRVECIDVSHTSGTSTRVGMVVFQDGEPLKSAYRTYALEGEDACNGDDYAALAAWMQRRLDAGAPWADLVLIDGGRGQLSAVRRVLQENHAESFFILAGIAKARDDQGRADRRAGNVSDRIFLAGRSNPLLFRDGSPELLFLQHVRDTAHRFVIGRHRKARANAALTGELMRISGIGEATARILWEHYKTLEAMTAATQEELATLPTIGARRAAVLAERLQALGTQRKEQ